MTRYFLDTTAHIERHSGDLAAKRAIGERPTGDRHASSSHVYREWRHVVERAAIGVLNATRGGTADLSEVFTRLSQGWGRSPAQRLRVLAMLTGQTLDVSQLAIRAETFLRSEADELFHADLDVVRDGSECGLAREHVRIEPDGRRSLRTECGRGQCVCVQPEFLETHKTRLDAATAALASVSRYREMARRADAAMANADTLMRTGRNCWRAGGLGGDLSIALECEEDEILLTTDESFDLIGPAVGIQVDRFPASTPP